MEGIDTYTRNLMKMRHEGIIMNPDGISKTVLPDERIIKQNTRTLTKRMVSLQNNHGYFWFLKDMRLTNHKPILSNEELIPVDVDENIIAFNYVFLLGFVYCFR